MFYGVNEVMKMLGVGRTKSYQIIKILNEELKRAGYMTVSGKVPKAYFMKRFGGKE